MNVCDRVSELKVRCAAERKALREKGSGTTDAGDGWLSPRIIVHA